MSGSSSKNRLQVVTSGLKGEKNGTASIGKPGVKQPDDVVIVCALRTPVTRARKGGLKDVHPERMLATVLKAILDRTGLSGDKIDDVVIGNVLAPGGGATVARMAALYAGIPETSSVMTCNRQCSSGLQAVAQVAAAIRAGYIEIGIGGGVESMSMNYGPGAMPTSLDADVSKHPAAADCLIPMGLTSENVAKDFGITRRQQDELAALSHARAAKARSSGAFKEEIVAVESVSEDDGIREETTVEALSRLRASFDPEHGTTTAGNSSQVSDGAAAVLLAKRCTAERLKLPILAKFVAYSVAGVPPRVMGIGPALAIPAVLKQANLRLEDVGIVELNEAFASQAVYCIQKLNIPLERVNLKGGAIALGHPLGATGARQIATILPEMRKKGVRYGVISMCIGTGMGAAALIENEQH